MRFIEHGNTEHRSLMLIHGMANTADYFDPLLPYLKDYHVVVCELDGHSASKQGAFISITEESRNIEEYVGEKLDGRLYGLLGFSLGATICVELLSRGRIEVEKTILDAAFTVKMGFMTYPFRFLFQGGIWCLKKGIHIPDFLVETVMGKGNAGVVNTLYAGVSMKTIGNACMDIYTYSISPRLAEHTKPVVFWCGQNEPFPKKSAKLLKRYLPQMRMRVFKGMGHGQIFREHTRIYARRLLAELR